MKTPRDTVDLLRKAHALGVLSRKQRPGRGKYKEGEAEKEAEAKRQGVTKAKLIIARRFANKRLGYTSADLERLCRELEKHPPASRTNIAFGMSHIYALLRVKDKRARDELQKQAIRNCWSVSELRNQIMGVEGESRKGGRRMRLPEDSDELRSLVGRQTQRWSRFLDELLRTEPKTTISTLGKLPKKIQPLISEMKELCERTLRELSDAKKSG